MRTRHALAGCVIAFSSRCTPAPTAEHDAASRADASWDATPCADATRTEADPFAADRERCMFGPGARVADTLGLDAAWRTALPVTHVIVVVQENRSFDHYFGTLGTDTAPGTPAWPADYTNIDSSGARVAPHHLGRTCLDADPPHQWDAMHAGWNQGAMDGFVRAAAIDGSDGHEALGYYEASDLPFYAWLASTYAIGDRYFASTLGGTWPNRDYLYAGTSAGVHSTGERALSDVRTVFDSLDDAGVRWGVFSDGPPRTDCLGWTARHRGVEDFATFLASLDDGSLPSVAFVDPAGAADEHPPHDVQPGEAWSRSIYEHAIASPLWPHLVLIFTYDESGGLFDHIPPPAACLASADQTEFDRLGIRVPFIVVSPWARPHAVSHRNYDHASTLRFVEAVFDLPALTARDANASIPLDLFDFACPSFAHPDEGPASGTGGCP